MLNTFNELTVTRNMVLELRNSAEQILERLDTVLKDTPQDLASVIDSLKTRVLDELSTKHFTGEYDAEVEQRQAVGSTNADLAVVREDPGPEGGASEPHNEDSIDCSFCDKRGIKNDQGYAIHLGRQHPKEAAKLRKDRRAHRKANVA